MIYERNGTQMPTLHVKDQYWIECIVKNEKALKDGRVYFVHVFPGNVINDHKPAILKEGAWVNFQEKTEKFAGTVERVLLSKEKSNSFEVG